MVDPRYVQFQKHVTLFNEKLNDYLQLVTGETNRSLREDFDEDFTIRFKYTPAIYNNFKYGEDGRPHGRTKSTKAPEIELIVELPNVGGISSNEVKRPHSYLNEARLSAIAIAIRLAILKERYIEQAPRIMVLDDLLLSLDLSNRSALLKIILKKYASRFQLIILTHDRVVQDELYTSIKDIDLLVIDEVYKLVGRPIDDINTLIKNCDDKVWDIYAKGLTTTINQADSDFGKQILKKYKNILLEYKKSLKEFKGGKSLHAPFWDLNLGSKNPGVTYDEFLKSNV